MKRFRIALLSILIGSLLCAASPMLATNPVVDRMEIDIWPEYDQSSVLVIYRLSLSSNTHFPTRVSIRIPSSAGNPYSVAMKDTDGLLYDLEYTLIPDGVWNKLEFITSSQDLQIEFYDPYVQFPNSTRFYKLTWISDFLIADVDVNIQKPKYASNISVEPNTGQSSVNADDGLTYYKVSMGAIDEGSTVNLRVTYIKTNQNLSASTVPVNSVTPLPEKRSVWQIMASIFPYIWYNKTLMVAVGLLLGGSILFNVLMAIVWKPGNKDHTAQNRNNPGKVPRFMKKNAENREIYCSQCGKRAKPGDIYCRTCGSKLEE